MQAFERILRGAKSREQADAAWTSFAETARYRVGPTPGERKVPFALSTDLVRCALAAQSELVALLRSRSEDLLLAPGVDVRIRAFGLRAWREGTAERRVALALHGVDPLLDAGLLEAWLRREGAGTKLLTMLTALYVKSLEEEVRQEGREQTAWITHVALTGQLRAQKEALKEVNLKGLGYESLERTVGLALSAIVAISVEAAFADIRARHYTVDFSRTEALLAGGITPMTLVAITNSILRPGPNAYGLPRELVAAIDFLGIDPLTPGGEFLQRINETAQKIGRDSGVRTLALDVAGLRELRGAVFSYLREFDVGREPRHEALFASVAGVHTLSAALAQVKAFEGGWHGAAAIAAAPGAGAKTADAVAKVYDAATRGKLPSDPDSALLGIAAAWLVYRYDRWAEERLEAARQHIIDRAKEFSFNELKANFEAGRVYRFAADNEPVLGEAVQRAEEGHFFLDLKGFTRMVAVAKETNAVEFMKHEFYSPILNRAKAYREAGRRLELNNLLGDAVSFSGDVAALVFLAEDVNQLFIEYEEKLRTRGVRANRIEAGLFIAWGAPPETIHVESEGWGDAGFSETLGAREQRIKVAIAEKINESARGTARSGAVWSRMQSLLEEDARRNGGEARELPWNVYVDRVLQLTLPPSVMELAERALDTSDPAFADATARAIGEVVREGLGGETGTARKMFAATADLYNVGRALSKEALDAFLRGTATLRVNVMKELAVSELPPAFSRFLFPEKILRLVVSYDVGKARRPPLLFRYAGDLQFRGYEGLRTTQIFEIVDSASPIYGLFERNFLEIWRPK